MGTSYRLQLPKTTFLFFFRNRDRKCCWKIFSRCDPPPGVKNYNSSKNGEFLGILAEKLAHRGPQGSRNFRLAIFFNVHILTSLLLKFQILTFSGKKKYPKNEKNSMRVVKLFLGINQRILWLPVYDWQNQLRIVSIFKDSQNFPCLVFSMSRVLSDTQI